MSLGPQSEEKGKGEEGCMEVKAGAQKKKKIKQALGKAGNGAQSEGCWLGMHEALG